VLLHPTSLPGRFGIGDLGPEADRFLEWAAASGFALWQVLPLGPTGPGNSPYGCASAFAGNALLVSPEELAREGLLPQEALQDAPDLGENRVEWDRVVPWKERLLRRSFESFPASAAPAVAAFASAPEQAAWLADWALFAALRARTGGAPWWTWDPELAEREPHALARARRELAAEVDFQVYAQFLFFRQWERVRRQAHGCGISIMGDAPIYVSQDSADVWAHRDLFDLDSRGRPVAVSGVPPDYFSPTGQLWGNPLYRWDRMERDGFAWWIGRLAANLRLCDLLRIDHFRAFAAYWSVPAGETTALNGQWVAAPGEKLFAAARAALGGLPIVAEDLGVITPDVEALLASVGVPGMKVLQFAFYEPDSTYLPHRHVPHAVVYTGTHDNDTARGWFARLSAEEKARVTDYLGGDGRAIEWDLIRSAFTSVCDRAIVPMQDILGLGSEARMNNPAEPAGNWSWRAPRDAWRRELAGRLRWLCTLAGRAPASQRSPGLERNKTE
jgi:4-alpha-glucanotransferase